MPQSTLAMARLVKGLRHALILCLPAILAAPLHAQSTYPNRPVKIGE